MKNKNAIGVVIITWGGFAHFRVYPMGFNETQLGFISKEYDVRCVLTSNNYADGKIKMNIPAGMIKQ